MTAMAVVNGDITLGMMLAIQYIIGSLDSPVNEFITFTRDLQDARLSMERITEIHEQKTEDSHLEEGWKPNNIPTESVNVAIQNVSFAYDPYVGNVLQNIDMVIPQGKITAIVGSSGSGKTTLMKLLLKFYSPTSGVVTVGGLDLHQMKTSTWRKHCGVVMQDGYIFSDTIAKNVALSGDTIDDAKLYNATRVANIDEFINSLPLGYNTKIGSNGIGLSQGQKQRILIARAVYKDPDFLFFDEATSALDANNEKTIIKNLTSYFQGKTVFIIAHRLSTVRHADQLIVLEKGKIVEQGTHNRLVETKGVYFELVRNQLELGS